MCPVCRARFRGASECSRCGADLRVVMTLSASAWRMRQAARQALAAGEFARARELASTAQQICRTPAGRRLEELGAWLGDSHRVRSVVEPATSSGSVELPEDGDLLADAYQRVEEMRYAVLYEPTATGYSAHVPDLPGCIGAAATLDEARELMKAAIDVHLEGMRECGYAIPPPTTVAEEVEVSA